MKTFLAETPEMWRKWLARHHETESEVWLVFFKRHAKQTSIEHAAALDEALCFGWIDSLVKRLDETRYAMKFTPRKANSRWSAINRKRYEVLKSSGRLQPSGIARAPTDRTDAPRPKRYVLPATVPRHIQAALRKQPAAWQYFQKLTPSHRRRYLAWIESAKRDDTKARRLREAIRLLAERKTLGLK